MNRETDLCFFYEKYQDGVDNMAFKPSTRHMSIDEMNAYRVAYSKKLGTSDYFRTIVLPGLGFGAFFYFLLFYWWIGLIMFLVGCYIGWRFILPASVTRDYKEKSFLERNRFLNNMTMLMFNPNNTLDKALISATDRANGELKADFSRLLSNMHVSGQDEIRDVFRQLERQYVNDIPFSQYIEQLEIIQTEGKLSPDSLENLKSFHNDLKRKQEYYNNQKVAKLRSFWVFPMFAVMSLVLVERMFGFKEYLNNVAHGPVGWVTAVIIAAGGIYAVIKLLRTFYDDDIMSL